MWNIALKKFNVNKKSFIIFSVCITIILYFIFYTIFGNRGIVDYFQTISDLKDKNLTKNELLIKIQDKQNLVDRMQNDSLDIDLLDEQSRRNLGYAKKNEIIIYNNNKSEE